MSLHKLFLGIILPALLLMAGCSAPENIQKQTWVDLAEIGDNVMRAKETVKPVELPPDDEAVDASGDEGEIPRVKDFSVDDDSGNPYLTAARAQKTFDGGEAIEGEGVMLNFDNADIYEVIQVIAEALDLSYIIDPQVKGVVNIRSGKKIPNNQLYTIFKKLLNINGIDIRPEGDHYYIHVAAKASSQRIYGRDQISQLENSPRLVTQVVPVVHISSAEAQKLVEPYLSAQHVIYNLADMNTLIISDFEAKILDALMILARLDVSSLAALKVKMVRVEQAPLFDLRDELNEILSALKINKKDYQGVQLVPLERVNSILLIGYNASLMDSAEKWVKELDRAPTEGRDAVYIYNVRNSVASELVELVSSLIAEKESSSSSSRKSSTSTKTTTSSKSLPGSASPAKTTTTSTRTSATATGAVGSMQFIGEPTLIADDSRNIILVRALLPDYRRILKLLERLDNLPMQVLIEVLVAEVSLTDNLEYGVEWAIKNNETEMTGAGLTFNAAQAGNTVFNVAFDSSTDIFELFKLLATDNDFSILSSPQVLVLNNEAASVNVGEQVPIVTSESTTSDSDDYENRTVQYKDTGVILTVTPKINYDGIIILEIDQQVSSVKDEKIEGIDSPIISTKQITTKLAVKDGQSILMGGLISRNDSETENGIPVLKDIPYLGYLFKNTEIKKSKTELLIMVTPYVIESEDVLEHYITNFKEKMRELRGNLIDDSEAAFRR